MPILMGIDVLGIQRYVFASNRLRDAVSASWLVHWATAKDGALGGSGGEVLLASGGGALLLFADEQQARDFAARYTRRLYDEAPGLEVAIAHRAFEVGQLARAIRQLQVDTTVAKFERCPAAPQLGLSVTASCRITGLPATGLDQQDGTLLSRMVVRWRDQGLREQAAGRWDRFFGRGSDYAFPREIDDMGRTYGETSLLGVVQVDGNGVGEQIASWLARCIDQGKVDEAVRADLAQWSTALDGLGRRALQAVVERVIAAVEHCDGEPRLKGTDADLAFALRCSRTKVLLPLRPVLLGGDDLSFLCDGRIALDLAETALDAFEASVPHLGRVTACAGVGIVPAHTPFDRAYALAEALCDHAKRRRLERKDTDAGAWIDWHVGAPRPGEGIGDLRSRAYARRLGNTDLVLTCRPYRLGSGPTAHETWRWLSATVLGTGPDGFRGEQWGQHRNKLMELASAVREGPEGVGNARQTWTAAADLDWPGGLGQTAGFIDGERTPLLDALELLDVHLPLREKSAT